MEIDIFILVIILVIYCFFIIWLLEGYKFIIKDFKKSQKYNPFVTVLVAARNEEKNLDKLLFSLNNQEYPKNLFEIVIVNDRSNDNSERILDSYIDIISNLKIINIDRCPPIWSGKKWALHNGIKQSKGKLILQTDADCFMSKNWIESMVAPFEDGSVGFVSSLTPLINKRSNIFNNLFMMDSIAQDIFSGYSIGKDLILSCNARSIAYRKSYFLEMKGYHQIKNIISGDDDLVLHKIVHYIGCRVKFISNKKSMVFSESPNTLKEFINQRSRYASKGFHYYKLQFISKEMKIILPFLFLVNLICCFLIMKFCNTGSPIYLIALLLKIIPDYFMINPIYLKNNLKWDWLSFIILSTIHPIYIVIFAIIGPLYRYEWK